MTLPRIIILIAIFGLLSAGMYGLIKERRALEVEINKLSVSAKALEDENKTIGEKIEYYKNPENIVKELKSQFNYHKPGEKMIIMVPKDSK